MKAISVLLLSLVTLVTSAQLKVADELTSYVKDGAQFTKVRPLKNPSPVTDPTIGAVVQQAELAQIDRVALAKVMREKPTTLEVILPYQGEEIVVQLFRVNPLAEEFNLQTDKGSNLPYNPGVYYRGIIQNEMTSLASFNFFDDQFNAIISSYRLSNMVVAPLDKPGNTQDYIVYEDQNLLVENDSTCEVTEDFNPVEVFDPVAARRVAESTTASKCVKLYFEVDHDIYVSKSSNVTQTTNWVTGLANHVQTLFANDNISVTLKSMFIWTTQDPYTGTNASTNMQRFRTNRPYYDGDVAQLIGIDAGSLGGVAAGVNTMCSTNSYAYSDINNSYSSVPTYSWTVQVVTHEFGHIMGSPHTHACVWNGNNTAIDNCGSAAVPNGEGSACKTTPATLPSSTQKGSIMSYCHLVSNVGISFNNGFGEQPRNRIIQAINNASCIATSCTVTCINGVNNLRQTDATPTSMTLAWDDVSNNTAYEVWVAAYGADGSWANASSATYTANNLTPNTFYRVRVRPACGGGMSTFYREFIVATPADWCENNHFITDTGGLYNNYANNEETVRTFYPGEGTIVRIQFLEFNVENNLDFLYIYDGVDTNAPLIGTYTGTALPPEVIPQNLFGAITFKFTSNLATTKPGFKARIYCEEKLATQDYNTLDFSYYPNPAKDVVNIRAAKQLNLVSVYNVTGQLVKQQKIDDLQAQVSVAEFASGTYFFVLEGEEGKGQFKIVKI